MSLDSQSVPRERKPARRGLVGGQRDTHSQGPVPTRTWCPLHASSMLHTGGAEGPPTPWSRAIANRNTEHLSKLKIKHSVLKTIPHSGRNAKALGRKGTQRAPLFILRVWLHKNPSSRTGGCWAARSPHLPAVPPEGCWRSPQAWARWRRQPGARSCPAAGRGNWSRGRRWSAGL